MSSMGAALHALEHAGGLLHVLLQLRCDAWPIDMARFLWLMAGQGGAVDPLD